MRSSLWILLTITLSFSIRIQAVSKLTDFQHLDKMFTTNSRLRHLLEGPRSDELQLDVRPTHFLIPNSPTITTFTDSPLMVSCKFKSMTNDSIIWISPNGTQVDPSGRIYTDYISTYTNNDFPTYDLIFDPVRNYDAGKYSCCSTNVKCKYIKSFHLQIKESFDFSQTEIIQTIIKGTNSSVICSVNPKPDRIMWYKNGKFIKNNYLSNTFSYRHGTLPITNVNTEDDGIYRCEANKVTNTYSVSQSIKIRLLVYFKPQWSDKPDKYVFYKLNTTINMSCMAEANPPAKISWFKTNSKSSTLPPTYLGSGTSLNIKFEATKNFGTYICLANNAIGGINTSTQISEEKFKPPKPKILIKKTHHNIIRLKLSHSSKLREQILGYKLNIQKQNQQFSMILTKDKPFIIQNLQPNTSYSFQAFTLLKNGAPSDPESLNLTTASSFASGSSELTKCFTITSYLNLLLLLKLAQ